MRKIGITVLIAVLVVLSAVCVAADSSDAKQNWLDAKDMTSGKKEAHQDAKLALVGNNTPENRQMVVDTGKDFQNAVLDEAEAWLDWKQAEAEEDSRVPPEIKKDIINDVEANKEKITELRTDVDNVQNQLQLGAVSLKMIGKYFELLTDVARNTGNMWTYIADANADKIETYDGKLRSAAENIENNDAIIEKLDNAESEIETARDNIQKAKDTYQEVKVGGTPFAKFAEGNSYLRAARANLVSAYANLNQAFILINQGYASMVH